MHSRSLSGRRLQVVATLGALVIFGVSCQDDPVPITSPRPAPVKKPIPVQADYVPVGGAISVPLSDSVSPSGQATLPYFATTTLVRVTLTGSVSTKLTPFNNGAGGGVPGAPRTFGPAGYYWGTPVYWGCGAQLRVNYNGGESYWPTCATDQSTDGSNALTAHLLVQGLGSATRTTAAPGTSGANDCSYYAPNFFSGWGACYYYSTTGQTVEIEKVRADFDLVATPDMVDYQDTVSFVASISPGSVGGRDVPWGPDSVRWEPEDGSYSGWSQPCAWNSFVPVNSGAVRTCRGAMTRSGTLTVFVRVNGEPQSRSVYVVVRRPKLMISPTYSTVLVGGSLSHTASVIPATKANGQPVSSQITSWYFRQTKPPFWSGQGCGAVTQCNTGPYGMNEDGAILTVYATINGVADSAQATIRVRPAYLTLTATPDFVTSGDSVSFAANVSPGSGHTFQVTGWRWDPFPDVGGISAPCGNGENPCVRAITKSGMMTVFGTVDGQYADSAAVAVVVFGFGDEECPSAGRGLATDTVVRPKARRKRPVIPARPSFDCTESPPLPAGRINLVCQANRDGLLQRDGRVVRGDTITCIAGGPTASDRVTSPQWKWIFGPNSPAPGLLVHRNDPQKAAPIWLFRVGVSGFVVVNGLINGASAQPDTVFVEVLARSGWADLYPIVGSIVPTQGQLPSMPKRVGEFGQTSRPVIEIPAGMLDKIAEGPNKLITFPRTMFKLKNEVWINTLAMTPGSAFWQLQPEQKTGSICSRTFLSDTLPSLVLAHEGSEYQANSHTWAWREGFKRQHAGLFVEQMIGVDTIRPTDLTIELKSYFDVARKYASHVLGVTGGDSLGLVPASPDTCMYNFPP